MNELAALAGVSVSTVSRALAGNPVITAPTRDRIVKLAREHGFQPNSMARNLRLKRSETIGVLIPLAHQADQHLSDPFFMTMIGYLADELAERGFDMLLRKVVPRDDQWLRQVAESGRVDGVLLIGQSNQHHVIDAAANSIPMVVWGARVDGQQYVSVGVDNAAGGQMVTDRLVGQGRKSLLFLGDVDAPEIAQREAGFRAACAAAGGPVSAVTEPISLVGESAYRDLLAIFDRRPDIDGIVAASDVIAIAAIGALQARGRQVPRDVAVVGFDNLSVAEHVTPALTTVAQDVRLGAQLMVDKLFTLLAKGHASSEEMAPRLVIRASA